MLDLTKHQNSVGQVLQDGSKLINGGLLNQNEDNEVRQQMKLLNDMWENLRIKAVEKQSKLHETLMKLQTEQLNQMDNWLLQTEKRIEIKVIKPKNGKGISHYKSGVFSDGQDSVGYKASCNFTLYGLSENLEELEAFLSWENGRSNKLIKKQLKLIDDYFAEKDEDVEYVSVNEIEVVLKDRFGKKDINELVVQEDQLLKKKQSLMLSNPKLKKTISKLFDEIEIIIMSNSKL